MSLKEDNTDEKENILRVLSDQTSRKILSSIRVNVKTASQISKEQNIELSKVYRRLQLLQKCDMLEITFQVTSDGKKSYYYKSKIEGMNVRYHLDNVEINLTYND